MKRTENRSNEPCKADKRHINKFKMAHMVGVAEYMRDHAEEYGLNPDEMYVLGLLHDIGYLEGRNEHEQYGAKMLSEMGLNMVYTYAICHHGDNPYALCPDGINPSDKAVKPYLLLLEGDMSVNAQGYRVGFDKRIEDIGQRYGFDSEAYKTACDNVRFIKENKPKIL